MRINPTGNANKRAITGDYVLDNGIILDHPQSRQASAEVRSAADGSIFPIPEGLTLTDLQECVRLLDDRDLVLYDHQARDESDPQNDCELIARIYERLRAAAERNSRDS